MSINCNCPVGASLTGFSIPDCEEQFGQVNKVIFQRLKGVNGVKNSITADPTLLATFTPFFAAVDGTKMVITPFVNNPTTTPGAKKTYGGGNATPGGIIKVTGAEPTTFVATFEKQSQSEVIAKLKTLMCENVGVYLINENGKILAIKETTAGANPTSIYKPIPISSLFIGDKGLGGLENPDTNAIEWSFAPNWSDKTAIITPAFDALSELVNVP